MFCIQCGKKIGDSDRFCLFCGKKVPEEEASPAARPRAQEAGSGEERVLVSFGPWGAQLCRGRAGVFTYTFYNKTRFELTTRRVRTKTVGWTVSRPPDFDISYDAIVSLEHFPDPSILFSVIEALYIRYREGEKIIDVSVVGDKGKIMRVYEILNDYLGQGKPPRG
jgi:hypothetical protein